MKKRDINLMNPLAVIGLSLWVLVIFLRGTEIIQNEIGVFLLGIAPNFGVGLIIPALAVKYYPSIFKKEIKFKQFILILIVSYILLFLSEVIHEKFLNSRIDFHDMIASLLAFGITVLVYKYKEVRIQTQKSHIEG